jgi:uncharacterized circularly permuted ATP-grasp superfamily protein
MSKWQPQGLLNGYDPGGFYCELQGAPGAAARRMTSIQKRLDSYSVAELRRRGLAAERELFNLGVTFTVYSSRDQIDRILPFDVIPRVLSAAEWQKIERGVIQRVTALNRFVEDVYGSQRILEDRVIPADLVLEKANYRPQMRGLKVPFGNYINICGVDIVRGDDGEFYVLEDNARTPSGVSYVVENRHLTQRAFPDLMRGIGVRSVSNYGQRLVEKMTELGSAVCKNPSIVLLSPGVFNSAYFEHVFLAREMGVPLVEGADLLVRDDQVFVKTTGGLQDVHVIYRRIDDDFLDPEVFRPDSMLGVPGLMRAYEAGNVVLANAVGTGIADDKAVYAYVPKIIEYYLAEKPVLKNVETHICRDADGLEFTLANLEELVVKPVGESGGYGILIGPKAGKKAIAEFRRKLKEDPDNYISQPVVKLSVCPTVTRGGVEPRHVDLRPFAITGESTWVLPGGLSRVALRKGSLIVNSSQGGGSKDTWVLE